MDEDTVKLEAIKLRKELANARNRERDGVGDGEAAADNGGYDQSGNRTTRSSVSVLHGTGATDGRRKRAVRSDGRPTFRSLGRDETKFVQSRSEQRRSIDPSIVTDSSSDTSTAAGAGRSVGTFERQDDVPFRQFIDPTQTIEPSYPRSESKRGPGRPSKKLKDFAEQPGEREQENAPNRFAQIAQRLKQANPGFQKPLTEQEAKSFYEPLKDVLRDYSKYADQYLNYRIPETGQIWSNLDNDELDALTTALLGIGKRSGTVGEATRTIVHSTDYVTTVMILIPRLMQTSYMLQKAPKRERTPRIREFNFRQRFRQREPRG